MKTDFDEFKAAFDSYLDLCEEPVEGILFLRYEDLEAASHLHTIQDEGFTPIVALQDHIDTLTDCQNYAVEHGVTSTYIFFKSHSYQQWLNAREWVDSPAHRAQWAQEQVDVEIVPHASRGIIWFYSTGVPVRQLVDVLE
ncbi:hypothetical protein [Verrucomicrobium spinosum]|uniref:hypothetical protein n=1 Tax=Verrucomicrobium spinosum TaxID=2736 RepID=UPI0001745BCB|nr:hypothetical protein [Verrucomicrobium spinosum]